MYAHHEHKPAKKTGMNRSKKVGSCISVYLQGYRGQGYEKRHPALLPSAGKIGG
jgi:hypothetical protein